MFLMRFRHFLLAPLALLVVALVVRGCGGGGSSSTTTTTAKKKTTAPKLSKAGFISQGDAICAEVNTAVGSTEESAAEAPSRRPRSPTSTPAWSRASNGSASRAKRTATPNSWARPKNWRWSRATSKKPPRKKTSSPRKKRPRKSGPALEEFQHQAAVYGFENCAEGPHAPEPSPESVPPAGEESVAPEESGGIESLPEEEVAPEEEFIPEEEVAPVEEEFVPETGGAGGEIEEVAPEEAAPEESNESGGIGPG